MNVAKLVDLADPSYELVEVASGRFLREWTVTHKVIEKFPTMQSLQNLAVTDCFTEASRYMGNGRCLSGIIQAHYVGVLAESIEHVQVIFVNGNCVWVNFLSHALKCNTAFAVIYSRHCTSANLFQNLVL